MRGGDATRWLALVLALLSAHQLWLNARTAAGIDYYQFWVAAHVASRPDVDSLYATATWRRVGAEFQQRAEHESDAPRFVAAARFRRELELVATPLLYATFRPFVSLRYDDDLRRFQLLGVIASAAAVLGLCRLARLALTPTLLIVALVLQWFQPLEADLRVGNVSQLQLAWVTAYLGVLAARPSARLGLVAGFMIGLALLFKPTLASVPAFLLLTWLVQRRFAEIGWQLAGAVLAVIVVAVVTWHVYGSLGGWMEWRLAVAALPPMPLAVGNFSPSRLVFERTGVDIATPLALGVSLLTVVWIAARGRRDRDPAGDQVAAGVGVLVYLLSAPLVWQHYLVLALVPALVLVGVPGRGRGVPWLVALALSAVAIDPWTDLLQLRSLAAQAMLTTAGLAALWMVSLWVITRR